MRLGFRGKGLTDGENADVAFCVTDGAELQLRR